MKIRHKQTGLELQVKKGDRFYETAGGSFLHIEDSEWEPVIEQEWEDVTAGCTAGKYGEKEFSGFHETKYRVLNSYIWIIDADGKNVANDPRYRLTKIDGLHHGPAFIVERMR
jgi:hypothetical protein